MVDLDPIPLADERRSRAGPCRARSSAGDAARRVQAGTSRAVPLHLVARSVALTLACFTAWRSGGVWGAMRVSRTAGRCGGTTTRFTTTVRLVTRAFLSQSGTTAGYDPSFMAGYPKSVIFPASSTLPELVVWAFGGDDPALAYKLYVLVSAAAIPWLVILAAAVLGDQVLRAGRRASSSTCSTSGPTSRSTMPAFGMLPYLLAIPLGLAGDGRVRPVPEPGRAGLVARFRLADEPVRARPPDGRHGRRPGGRAGLRGRVSWPCPRRSRRGGGFQHAGTAAQSERDRLSLSRHLGVWLIPIVVLAANAFWWLPGIWLASTKGASDFAFSHSRESVVARLVQIVTTEAPVQSLILALGPARPARPRSRRSGSGLGAGRVSASRASSGATWPAARSRSTSSSPAGTLMLSSRAWRWPPAHRWRSCEFQLRVASATMAVDAAGSLGRPRLC